jgi:histidyl-tRNA synthetase
VGARLPEAGECAQALARIVRAVEDEARGRFTIAFDPALVRGMGYYTGPIFEAGVGGQGSSIAGGGRYDRMIGRLIGHDVPACGFSIGFERVVSLLEEARGVSRPERDRIALLYEAGDSPPEVIGAAGRLRSSAGVVSLMRRRKNLSRQLDDLAREGFGSYAMFRVGASEPEVKPLELRDASRGA